MVFHFDATRASVTRKLGHLVFFQVSSAYLVRRIGHNLLGWQGTFLDQPADTMGRDAKLFGCFGQREPLAILFCGLVAVDFMDGA